MTLCKTLLAMGLKGMNPFAHIGVFNAILICDSFKTTLTGEVMLNNF
jgi:hypothetical protein